MPKEPEQRKKGSGKKIKVVLLSILFILVILVGYGAIRLNNMLNQVELVVLEENELGIREDVNKQRNITPSNTGVINIALFGIDTHTNEYVDSLSDTIIIATIDFDHNKLKLTSIMRDTYLKIPEHGYNRVNTGYAYGGPSLAIKTINTNFDMNITDFATVNFEAMEKIIDSVGGVEIDVKSNELAELNHLINELNWIQGGSTPYLKSAGFQTLDGRQALAYSRIRKVAGQSDYERTERQRTVLEQILSKVLADRSIGSVMAFAENLLPYVKTSLTQSEILSLGTKFFTNGISDFSDTRIPLDDHVKSIYIGRASVLLPKTLLDNVKYLHNFIYENDAYEPSDGLLEINEKLKSYD